MKKVFKNMPAPRIKPAKKKTTLSLIICTRNRAQKLNRCLASISAKEMKEVQGELILVGNCPTDDTEKIMQSFKKRVRFPVNIVKEPKPGLGRARNAGIMKAAGDIFVFTDDDCYLTPKYLSIASRAFASGNFHYGGGLVLLYDKSDAMHCSNSLYGQVIPPYSIVWPGKIIGCNMVIHRKVVEKIGLFDPLFGTGTPFYCDDSDYIARASLAGFTGKHVPDLVIYHHHGRKEGKELEKIMKCSAYGRGAFFAKLILMGKINAIKHWIKSFGFVQKEYSIGNPLPLIFWEMSGAIRYLVARAKSGSLNERAGGVICTGK